MDGDSRPNLYFFLFFSFLFFKGGNKFKLQRELNHLSVTPTSFGNSYHALTGPKAALLFELIHRRPHELEKRSLEEQRVWQRAALLNLCSQLNPKLGTAVSLSFAAGGDRTPLHRAAGWNVFTRWVFWFKSVP